MSDYFRKIMTIAVVLSWEKKEQLTVKFKGYLWVAALVILFLLTSVGGTYAAEMPKQLSQWGMEVSDASGKGVLIKTVLTPSSADSAGLQSGDVLLSVNGVAVNSAQEFWAVKDTFPLYTPVNLVVKRNEASIERRILLAGTVRLEVKEINSEFVIPGVPPSPSSVALSAIDSLDIINVLDQVVLDPKTGKIAIIGHYDRDYNTGPIPYLDLLKTALVYPAPRISLDPTPESVKQMLEITPSIQIAFANSNMRATMNQMLDVVQGHPDAERERQILIRELSKAYGLSPEDYVAWYNYVKLGKNKEAFPPPLIRDIQVKAFRNLGYGDFAQALELTFQMTQAAATQALQLVGQGDEARAIAARSGTSGEQTLGALMVAVYLHILPRTVVIDPKDETNLRDAYASGRITWQTVVASVQDRLLPYHTNSLVNLKNLAFMKIIISTPAALLIAKAKPFYSLIRPTDLDRNSQMARILYEADYAMKSLAVTPEMFRKIPGFLSTPEYDRQFPGGVNTHRFWFEPKMVVMAVAPERQTIAFGSSQMMLRNENANDLWGLSPVTDNRYDAWCANVMNNYDAYARILPSFHKLREAAKVIALAKWVLAEKISIDLADVGQEKWSMPDTVPGFFTLGSDAIQVSTGSQTIVPLASQDSGVSFNPKGSWTQISLTPSVTTEVSSQLAMSASLGKQAVQAAQGGNLESARYLAELSAQAMNGSLTKSDRDKVLVIIPQVAAGPVSPESVQLQKEMLKKTHQQITLMTQNPSQKSTASSTLIMLSNLFDQIRNNPAAASDYLSKLQASQASSTTGAVAPPVNSTPTQSGANTPRDDKQPAEPLTNTDTVLGVLSGAQASNTTGVAAPPVTSAPTQSGVNTPRDDKQPTEALIKTDKVLGVPWGATEDEATKILGQRPKTRCQAFVKNAVDKSKGCYSIFSDENVFIQFNFFQGKMYSAYVVAFTAEDRVMGKFNSYKQGLAERYGAPLTENGKLFDSQANWDLGGGYNVKLFARTNTLKPNIWPESQIFSQPYQVVIYYFHAATDGIVNKASGASSGKEF